jgi:tetratricopeptide (TPR) repeat protein
MIDLAEKARQERIVTTRLPMRMRRRPLEFILAILAQILGAMGLCEPQALALLKIPSWEGKEGFSLQGWVSSFATTHSYTPPAEGNFHRSPLGMNGSPENPPSRGASSPWAAGGVSAVACPADPCGDILLHPLQRGNHLFSSNVAPQRGMKNSPENDRCCCKAKQFRSPSPPIGGEGFRGEGAVASNFYLLLVPPSGRDGSPENPPLKRAAASGLWGFLEAHKPLVKHSIRGRVLFSYGNEAIKVTLTRVDGIVVPNGERILGYDGIFAYENLVAGNYLLTIESPDSPTIARPIQLKEYPTAKTVFLEIRVSEGGSARIQEVVREYTEQKTFEREDDPSLVSKKAARQFQKALEQSEKGNYTLAVEYLKNAIREKPGYFEAYNNLGVQYQKLERWDAAVQAFLKAIDLRKNSIKPRVNLGNTYLKLAQLDSAIETFRSALEIDGNSVPTRLALGQAYFQKKDYRSAEEHLEIATKLDPKGTKDAFALLIRIELLNKEYEKAKYFLNRMLECFPSDPEAQKLRQLIDSPSDKPTSTRSPE